MTLENAPNHPDWRAAGLRFFRQSFYYKTKFGQRVQKISLDGGFTCPNVDGSITTGGCTFCDNRSFSPSRRTKKAPITEQMTRMKTWVRRRYGDCKFIAYFQPATNTYAPVEKLRKLYEIPLLDPDVVGIAIGTRPDCVPNPVLDYIEELATRTHVCLEYGMQTMHNASLDWMNRGHHHDAMVEAMERSRGRGFEIAAHLILGLPGETTEMMMQSVNEVIRLGIDTIKIHNLYAVERTPLADQVRSGEVTLMELEDYVPLVVDIIERLPPTMVVERVSGDAPSDFFIGPQWSLDKPALQKAIAAEFTRRDAFQGKNFSTPTS